MKTSLMLLLPLVALLSCKDDDNQTGPATKTQLLTAKPWKITGRTVDPGQPGPSGTTITDLYANMPACERDNLYSYSAGSATATGGTATRDEGPSKCNSADPQTLTGTWVFNADQTEITDNIGGTTQTYSLLEISATTMKHSTTTSDYGITYTHTITYTAQ